MLDLLGVFAGVFAGRAWQYYLDAPQMRVSRRMHMAREDIASQVHRAEEQMRRAAYRGRM
ncbi:hypothetical protein F7R91_01625 [Streptomyces luteolifulvus]|uniref:Uncharacterized protein n=1 Tax=Streptomyces luteolifulvus TaxID=2615112 RepID=A0A6H9V9K1_9ACTN|nr:hypothetical protein [Streptomyces luteolifulvus]KAB1150705.1 hypothetical protein F7R91_01625 [Streptomyces luteolifulvus]